MEFSQEEQCEKSQGEKYLACCPYDAVESQISASYYTFVSLTKYNALSRGIPVHRFLVLPTFSYPCICGFFRMPHGIEPLPASVTEPDSLHLLPCQIEVVPDVIPDERGIAVKNIQSAEIVYPRKEGQLNCELGIFRMAKDNALVSFESLVRFLPLPLAQEVEHAQVIRKDGIE